MKNGQSIPVLVLDAGNSPASKLSRLQHLALWLKAKRRVILAIQWLIVVLYLVLVLLPAFMPLPTESARIHNNLVRGAQFLFWGIWWPFVILSMLLMGRVWCGVFCPEGTLTEWVSKYSLNLKPLPHWIKWPGWPFVAFVGTTVYGQMISVYDYAKPVLLILGGSTGGAMLLAFFYGRERRVWCKYLCPVNGVFHLLARVSPLQVAVDKTRWDSNATLGHAPVICAPLINIRQMNSMAECHQCFRCAGHRDAVAFKIRSPNAEIVNGQGVLTRWHHLLIIFGVLGLASSAFQWSASPWFVTLKQWLANWAVNHEQWWMLENVPAWFIFTHYPQANDVFNWVDGFSLLLYLSVGTTLLGVAILLGLAAAARVLNGPAKLNLWRLSESLTPLCGLLLFLGLSMTTANLLHQDGIEIPMLLALRASLLLIGVLWSAYLFLRLISHRPIAKKLFALTLYLMGLTPLLYTWLALFWVW